MASVWLHQALTHCHKGLPCGAFLSEGQNSALGMGLYQSETNKAAKYSVAEGKGKFLVEEVTGKCGKSPRSMWTTRRLMVRRNVAHSS